MFKCTRVNTASYSYVANSPLVSDIDFKQSGTTRMTTTKSYDYLNRLMLITNHLTGAGAENPSFTYAHNAANQRVGITNADASRWGYTYDSLGQVTSGSKRWSDGSVVLGQQFEYTFDDIGNRKTAVSGGDASGRQKRTQNYTANNLNQYTQRTVPGYLDIIGSATNAATVTVNRAATSRKGDYYRGEVPVANSAAAAWPSITNVAVMPAGTNDYVTNAIGNQFVPKTPEAFGYDLDGNMTNDGRWAMTWDGENRLIAMESLQNAPVGSSNGLIFAYDEKSRRVSKAVQTFSGGSWSITLSNRFIYDGWNLLAELNATNKAVINFFMWGLDLSGSMQAAGGVGGLLSITTTNAGTHFAGYDGNGNVTLLASASSGAASANYEYDPFGNVLRATGPMSLLNPFRFSTKFADAHSELNYYGYRFYNASQGRWLSRDPLAERASRGLYTFVNNDGLDFRDILGLVGDFLDIEYLSTDAEPHGTECGGKGSKTQQVTLLLPDAKKPDGSWILHPVKVRVTHNYSCSKGVAEINPQAIKTEFNLGDHWTESKTTEIGISIGIFSYENRNGTVPSTGKVQAKPCPKGNVGSFLYLEYMVAWIVKDTFGLEVPIIDLSKKKDGGLEIPFPFELPSDEKVVDYHVFKMEANCCCPCARHLK